MIDTNSTALESSGEARFLIVEPDPRARAARARDLSRCGIGPEQVLAFGEAGAALRSLGAEPAPSVVAFLAWAWPIEPEARALVSTLRGAGAYVVAMVPRERWESAVDVYRDGADDVLLTPCSPHAFAVRALVARDAARHVRPAPWHRPRRVLNEALAHAVGGEVLVRAPSGCARVVVSHGRVAWVHDDGDLGSLVERLRASGVRVTADELALVVAECQRTREHFADVLARWGLAEPGAVSDAVRALIDRRLQAALARPYAAALFAPSRTSSPAKLGFKTEELRRMPGTLPPPRHHVPSARGSLDANLRARCERVAREAHAAEGCLGAAALHFGVVPVVAASGETDRLTLAWSLGAALDALDDPAADVFASCGDRCHLARRIAGAPECVLYATFDLQTTSLALARRTLAAIAERAPPAPETP